MEAVRDIDAIWAAALRYHVATPLIGNNGTPFRPIGDRSLAMLDALRDFGRRPAPDLGELIQQGRAVKFWADPHFHDGKLLKKKRRPFADTDAMNAALWAAADKTVAEADVVVCLGDLADYKPTEVLEQLADRYADRHLTVIGNHDARRADPKQWAALGAAGSMAFSLPVATLRAWLETDHPGGVGDIEWEVLPDRVCFGLSHWPVPIDRLPGPEWVNIHGHLHQQPARPLHISVSAEAIDYRPRTLRELLTPPLDAGPRPPSSGPPHPRAGTCAVLMVGVQP